jgi:hypothetical protein
MVGLVVLAVAAQVATKAVVPEQMELLTLVVAVVVGVQMEAQVMAAQAAPALLS